MDLALIIVTLLWLGPSLRRFWLAVLYLRDARADLASLTPYPTFKVRHTLTLRDVRNAWFLIGTSLLMVLLVVIALAPLPLGDWRTVLARADLDALALAGMFELELLVRDKQRAMEQLRVQLRRERGE